MISLTVCTIAGNAFKDAIEDLASKLSIFEWLHRFEVRFECDNTLPWPERNSAASDSATSESSSSSEPIYVDPNDVGSENYGYLTTWMDYLPPLVTHLSLVIMEFSEFNHHTHILFLPWEDLLDLIEQNTNIWYLDVRFILANRPELVHNDNLDKLANMKGELVGRDDLEHVAMRMGRLPWAQYG